jgi:glycosyltransferase involved in cell wall biosynthesis
VRPVKLGIFFDQSKDAGGGYQQAKNALKLVLQLPANLIVPVIVTHQSRIADDLRRSGLDVTVMELPTHRRVALRLRSQVSDSRVLASWRRLSGSNAFERVFLERGVDLVYFLSPTPLACNLEQLCYVATVWDLCHRDHPEFPEVSAGRLFERRELLYWRLLPKAVAVVVDSATGKSNVMRRYGVDEERVHIVPFSFSATTQQTDAEQRDSYVDAGAKYDLTVPYVFYPAQFWPHKNHVYLLEGLQRLEANFGIKVGAIFAGGDKGNLAYVQGVAAKLGIHGRVRYAGFVPDAEIPHLYRQSLALVMPTYFGPTNLPPLEAFSLGVPVLYPDRPDLREQVGDAALLVDLMDPDSIARQLAALCNDPELRALLVQRGRAVLGRMTDEHRLKALSGIIEKFQRRRACWP